MDPFVKKILKEVNGIIPELQKMAEKFFPDVVIETLDSYRKELYLYTKDGIEIGDFSYEDDDFKGYLPISTAMVKPEFRNKGYYQNVLELFNQYAKLKGKKGICSVQWDTSSGEFERSDDANKVWVSLEKKGKAFSKILGKDEGLVYFYK